MFNRNKAALIAAALLGTSALMIPPAEAGLDGNPFEGLYVGLNGNYAKVKSTNIYTDLDPDSDVNNRFTGIGATNSGTGYGGNLYGGIGTNIWGPLYGSVEGALGLSGGSGKAVVNTFVPATDTVAAVNGTDTVNIKAGFSFDINARLGFTVSDSILVYALGGYTSTKFKLSDSVADFSISAGGYRYGAGFEVGIMEDMALRIEYVRTAHSAINWVRVADQFSIDPSMEVFRIGVILHMD